MFKIEALPTAIMLVSLFGAIGCGGADGGAEEGRAFSEGEEQLGEVSQAAIREHWVGVIRNGSTSCNDGGADSDDNYVIMHLENEHDNNKNSSDGWKGWFTVDTKVGGTLMPFCKVRGSKFKRPKSGADNTYAVLQLDDSCPPGSKQFQRYFDNEDDPCDNGWWPGNVDTCGTQWAWGDVSPSYAVDNNVWMYMCVFEGSSSGASDPFPTFGDLSYGVFGGGGAVTSKKGYIRTDDEDDNNNNKTAGADLDHSSFLYTGGHNTRLNLKLVE